MFIKSHKYHFKINNLFTCVKKIALTFVFEKFFNTVTPPQTCLRTVVNVFEAQFLKDKF